MTGKKKKWVLWICAGICFWRGVISYVQIRENESVSLFFTGEYPDRDQALRILEDEKQKENPIDVCFLLDKGMHTAQVKTYERQQSVWLCEILGNAALYDEYIQGFAEEDIHGCVIDKGTAYALFGSENVIGSEIFLNGKTYMVRQIFPWKQPVMIIHSHNKKDMYSRMFIRPQEKETKKDAAEAFLLRQGLSGNIVREFPVKKIAFFVLMLFPGMLCCDLFLLADRERKENRENKRMYYIWMGASCFVIVFFLCWFVTEMEFPAEWIPGKWSDFSFWSEKWNVTVAEIKNFLMLPKTVMQAEQILLTIKTVSYSFGAFLLYLLGERVIMREK